MSKVLKGPRARNRVATATDAGDILCRVGHGAITLSLDPKVYPLGTVHGAAYLFLARTYVRLDRARDGRMEVRLAGKTKLDRAALEALAGEFANELTNQYVREEVAQKTTRLREAVVGRALLGALGTGDELTGLGGDPGGLAAWTGAEGSQPPVTGNAAEDPMGIATDWEVRFGHPADKQKPDALFASDPGKEAGHVELGNRGLTPTPPAPMPERSAAKDTSKEGSGGAET